MSDMTTDPTGASALSETEIRRLVGEIAADSSSAEAAWQVLRGLDAIQHQNHHYFVDTQHSGRSFWVVNETDDRSRLTSDG